MLEIDEEDYYPNVLTEEVTNDRRFDDEQITVNLTPCSHHENLVAPVSTGTFAAMSHAVSPDPKSLGRHSLLTS